jgi:hypothetical protein
VNVVRNGPVTTVIIDRPHARNAVNGPTAVALFEAFEEFDRDDSALVAVLWGDHGTFCAGADLKAVGTPDSNPTQPTGTGPDVAGPAAPAPMGPTRMVLSTGKLIDLINAEFTEKRNDLWVSSITYGQNCIIITKQTEEERRYFDRPYRFSRAIHSPAQI